jgi:hypothetical protein
MSELCINILSSPLHWDCEFESHFKYAYAPIPGLCLCLRRPCDALASVQGVLPTVLPTVSKIHSFHINSGMRTGQCPIRERNNKRKRSRLYEAHNAKINIRGM